MHRTLIVAKMRTDAAKPIAEIFGESDARGQLPHLIGVRARSLYQFGEVYLHLIEGDRPIPQAVAAHAQHPEFQQISTDLRPYVAAYDPATWREPKDAMAHEFYRWERSTP